MDFSKYENKLTYPVVFDFSTYNVYYEGKILGLGINREEKNSIKSKYPKAIVETIKDEAAFREARDTYYAEESSLKWQFWHDFAEEVGISENHPKFGLLQRLAWDYGHSAGYSEVYSYAVDLALFLR